MTVVDRTDLFFGRDRELVPVLLGLLAPEAIAALVAAPMNLLARATRPLVPPAVLVIELGIATDAGRDEPPVTDDEINVLMLPKRG